MKTKVTFLYSHERCRKLEEECRRSGKSVKECEIQRRRCEKASNYM